MKIITRKAKTKNDREAKVAVDYLQNGIHRGGSWVRVCLIYRDLRISPRGLSRLIDALSIHFAGVGFASSEIETHYEIACSSAKVADSAREYIAGWLAK